MPTRFHTQAEYYLLLAQVAYTPEDRALLLSMGCAWHRLGQEFDLRDEGDHQRASVDDLEARRELLTA
jgi:hypothetical protein